ncbi:hypothetical protein PMAYCL1PPCAC_31964, partial [Pristionchus mayeri]
SVSRMSKMSRDGEDAQDKLDAILESVPRRKPQAADKDDGYSSNGNTSSSGKNKWDDTNEEAAALSRKVEEMRVGSSPNKWNRPPPNRKAADNPKQFVTLATKVVMEGHEDEEEESTSGSDDDEDTVCEEEGEADMRRDGKQQQEQRAEQQRSEESRKNVEQRIRYDHPHGSSSRKEYSSSNNRRNDNRHGFGRDPPSQRSGDGGRQGSGGRYSQSARREERYGGRGVDRNYDEYDDLSRNRGGFGSGYGSSSTAYRQGNNSHMDRNWDRRYESHQYDPSPPSYSRDQGVRHQPPQHDTFSSLEREYADWGSGDLSKELDRLSARMESVRRLIQQSYQPSPYEIEQDRLQRKMDEERRMGMGVEERPPAKAGKKKRNGKKKNQTRKD